MINFSIYKNVPSIPISNLSKYHLSDNFPTYSIRLEPEKKVEQEIEETPKRFTKTDKLVISKPNKPSTKINNKSDFITVLDRMAKSDPTIAKNKDILSKLAMAESSQRWNARNGKAYGAFQLMDFNIQGDVNDFLNNPEEQIRQANRLLESNKKQITDNDLKLAKEQGYTYDSLLGGSWLGGIGGMRKVLTNTGNPRDKDGADVKSRMEKFKFDTGGEIPNPAYPRFQINNWLDKWNQARLNTGNFDDQLGNGLLEQQKQNRDNTPIFYDSQTRDEELGITNPMMSRSLNSNIGLSSDGTNINITPGFYYKGNQSLNSFIQVLTPEARNELNQNYNNKLTTLQNRFDREDIEWQKLQANKTLVDNAFNELSDFDSTLLHEQSHASIATPQENRIDQIITNKVDNYLDSPTEIYSRLNQLRKYYNFDPNKLWDKKDIRELKRKNGPTFDILDRYSDEELIRLFNEVADNSSIPSDQYTIYARNGVKLTKEQQEYINRLQKNQPQLKADNRTKELKEVLDRNSKNKRIGNTIKETALNTAEGITSAVYPVVGAGLAIKNAFTNPTGAYIDVASMVIPELKGVKNISKYKTSAKVLKQSDLEDNINIPEQDKAIKTAREDMYNAWNNSKDLSNIDVNDKAFTLKLNLDIERRIADNMNYFPKERWTRKLNQQPVNTYTYDEVNNTITNLPNDFRKEYVEATSKSLKDQKLAGLTNFDPENPTWGDIDVYLRRYSEDRPISSKGIYNNATHEYTHAMQQLYGINYDNFNRSYFLADKNNPVSQAILKYSKDTNWAKSINEHDAELWSFRMKNKIGSRDLTRDEAIQFIKESPELYNEEVIKNPPEELIDNLLKLASLNLIVHESDTDS